MTTHYSGLNYRIGGEVTGRYGWLDKRWLAEDANRQPYATLLYPYLVWQWELGWHQHGGVFKRNVPAVLRDIGIASDRKNYARQVKALRRGLDHLHRQNYVGQVEFSTSNGRLLVSVEAPAIHPVRTLRRGREKS